MARLLLLRHARAAWAEPGMRDFDRPLDMAGRIDADAMGAVLAISGSVPDLVICSGARRARETWDAVAKHLHPTCQAIFTDELYVTDAAGYLTIVKNHAASKNLMLVGHNPMIEDVCFAIAAQGEQAAKDARAGGFPACGLAVIDMGGSLADAAPGAGYLEAFHSPAEF